MRPEDFKQYFAFSKSSQIGTRKNRIIMQVNTSPHKTHKSDFYVPKGKGRYDYAKQVQNQPPKNLRVCQRLACGHYKQRVARKRRG
jgi:hypothetical protein